ncbi:hypothetical protein G5I_07790 [Acromyrmex echinatior]|uniref:Uncharacterized protein n=1 Tax=Acromyrmex echinatior TaxID=103372 RepID=F4WPS6_ACREC|nr:hypothetical protein G5I_07790 [Acromyrmex echinatior]
MWRKRSASKKRVESVCGETKPRGNQNAKGKSWKLYDYLAVAAQVQALPPVLSHLELDPQENIGDTVNDTSTPFGDFVIEIIVLQLLTIASDGDGIKVGTSYCQALFKVPS